MEFKENAIEWKDGEHYCTNTFTTKRFIKKINEIYKDRADEFRYFKENDDGSVCAKFPVKWIKINPGAKPGTRSKREYTDEEKKALRERLAAGKAKKAATKK